MKKEIEYHEVSIRFNLTNREAKRVTDKTKSSDVRSALADLIVAGLTDNATNVMDIEDVVIEIDGKGVLGA